MTKENMTWVAIAVVVLGGLMWYLSGSSDGTGTMATTTADGAWTATTTAPAQKPSGAKPSATKPVATPSYLSGVNSLNYLLSLKSSLKCTVATTGVPLKRSGTLYVSDTKARGEFTSTASGTTLRSTMIHDGQYLYTWKEGQTKGLKLLAAVSANGSAAASYGGIDPAVNLDFDCNKWTPDASLFVAPANVAFTDTSGN